MGTNKKPFYKKWWFILIVAVFVIGIVAGISEEVTETNVPVITKDVTTEKEEVEVVEEETKEVEPSIDTSVFEYATNTEVTDAININQHITVQVHVSEEAEAGMSVLNVVKQSYDFILQEDVKDAKTITIFVTQNDKKIVQYTIQKDKFAPNDNVPMSDLVLKASEIEFMTDEVKTFGKTMESW